MLGKVITAAALACALTPANAELLTHKDLPLAVAKTIAETAIADCKARGYAVSVVVVDRAGDTLGDAGRRLQPAHHGECAARLYTARSFRQPTAAYIQESRRQ